MPCGECEQKKRLLRMLANQQKQRSARTQRPVYNGTSRSNNTLVYGKPKIPISFLKKK